MGKKRHLIAIVDDDTSVRESTIDLVQSMGFAVKSFPCAEDFLMSEDIRDTSCLIADMRMSGMSGLELHAHLAGSGRAIPTIVITAYPNERDRLRARQFGIRCYLAKPFSDDELVGCIQSAIASRGG